MSAPTAATTVAAAPSLVAPASSTPWDGVPTVREWSFIVVSIAGFLAALPPISWPAYAAAFALVYFIGTSNFERRQRLIAVLGVLAVFLFFERQIPRPTVPYVLWGGRAIRAFFLLRAIDFALSRPRRELSSRSGHRVFQFLLYVTFLPTLFAGPVVLFNDFYRGYLPSAAIERTGVARHAAKMAWGTVKFFIIAPYLQVAVFTLYGWAHEGGGPANVAPRLFMWGFMFLQIIDVYVRFSGFTDMVIAVSRLLGFQLDENFRSPLLATSPIQYWKSWHISAYRWLMTHVFYPSWGHQQTLLKIQTTFAASAIWHLSIAQAPSIESAAQLLSAGVMYASGVWLVGAIVKRQATASVIPHSRVIGTLRAAPKIAATFVFISFVHMIFRDGLTARPVSETWSNVRLLLGPAPRADAVRRPPPVRLTPSFVRSEHDRLYEMIPDVRVLFSEGRSARLSQLHGPRGLVVVTVDSSCAVSRQYMPRLASLEAVASANGFRFLYAFRDNGLSSDEARRLAATHGLNGLVVLDVGDSLGRVLGARTSAEAFVLDARRTLVYRGAIDDQYRLEETRAVAERSYLAAALDDVAANRPVVIPATSPPGCPLGLSLAPLTPPADPTYAHQVSRIIQARCLMCHHRGGAAPFSLETYSEVVSRRERIAAALRDGRMPPWFAAPESGPWSNDLTLTTFEKQTLLTWLDSGTPSGSAADAPVVRPFVDGWDIGVPDTIITLPAQAVPATGELPYQYSTIDIDFPEDRWVQAIQFRPTARGNMHHALVFLEARRGPIRHVGGAGYASAASPVMHAEHGLESHFAAYGPGHPSITYPPRTAKRLPRRTRLVFQLHYIATGTPATDTLRMGLVFAKQRPEFEVQTSSGYNRTFEIPAGHPNYPVTGVYRFTEPGLLLSFLPHMHLRGKSFRYELVQPDGSRRTLLWVPKYGFNSQVTYMLASPIPVDRGTRIIATGRFDNSKGNPINPDPTVSVRFGMMSSEEMMIGYFDWIPNEPIATRKVTPVGEESGRKNRPRGKGGGRQRKVARSD